MRECKKNCPYFNPCYLKWTPNTTLETKLEVKFLKIGGQISNKCQHKKNPVEWLLAWQFDLKLGDYVVEILLVAQMVPDGF
jgi:hypothetical protein